MGKIKEKNRSAEDKILVIVESPAKARTISEFIGNEYKVESSYGHIRDLPKSKIGIDIEKKFEPQYIIPVKSKKRVNELKKESLKSSRVILATDEDREGEAIAWHLAEALELPSSKYERIAFHEITPEAIQGALKNPRKIFTDLVNAQQARRVLDRLVGYKLSPFLWKKIMGGLSVGRVQSVAVRLIVEKEEEIRKFVPEIYYTIKGIFEKDMTKFEAVLIKIGGKSIAKPGIKEELKANDIISSVKKSNCLISSIQEKEISRSPNPPFITSSLQQESSRKLGFSSKTTMMIAQKLYEQGHITYMRTDSFNLSSHSILLAKEWLIKELGEEYSMFAPRAWKNKSKSAQEAHEAIRPTNPKKNCLESDKDEKEKKLYNLIWRRFMASQMPDAIFLTKRILIQAGECLFSASGNLMKFDGYLKIWPSAFEEKNLPANLKEGDALSVSEILKEKHITEPPARYDEASLIKALEELGIGRPSTYASIISVIQTRQYVLKNERRRFAPTDIGEKVNKLLTEHFPQIVDVGFTAEMENKLDLIASGKEKWKNAISDFYFPFAENLEKKYVDVQKEEINEETDEICEKCNKPMIIKRGRFGRFIACSGYPECKNTKRIPHAVLKTETGEEFVCPKCNIGKIVAKKTKKGRLFYGCNSYPACDFASWTNPVSSKQ